MTLTKKDFQNENEVRWCPGCGNYAILATVQKTLADLDIDRANTVFVSGIGCAARFPYYMNTYGLHTIHGRAPAIATGLKLARPDLNVFLVTGDGDGLSIGAGHLFHLFRRNLDIKVLLFNNQIYGLTKGQASPTSIKGQKAKSTPFGSLENPVNPLSFALAAQASMVARSLDNDALHLGQILKEAILHKGTALVEILQTCVVFNDDAFSKIRDKTTKDANIIKLKENEPLLFDNGQKGLSFAEKDLRTKIVLGHDASVSQHSSSQALLKAQALAQLSYPDFPMPIGVLYKKERPIYEELKQAQHEAVKAKAKTTNINDWLKGSNVWEI